MKITKSQLENIIREELTLVKEASSLDAGPEYLAQRAKDADKPAPSMASGGSTMVNPQVLQQVYYDLDDKVWGPLSGSALEPLVKELAAAIKEELQAQGSPMEEAAPAPGSQAFPRGLAPELDRSPEGQARLAAKQEYDALTTMITRLDGMESFLLNATRQKSDEALTQQAAEQLNALHATLSQLRKGL